MTALGEGVSEAGYYKLSHDGIKSLKEGYEENAKHGTYKKLTEQRESMEEMGEEEVKRLGWKYEAIEVIEPSFTPFVSEEVELSDDEIEDVVRGSYSELETSLREIYLGNLFEQYSDSLDGQKVWKSGVDANLPFYQDVHNVLYPEVEDLAVEDGMEFLINEAYSLFWQPTESVSFYGPAYDLEVLAKESERFRVKQTKEIGSQDIGGTSYDIVYVIDYVKKDGKWMFAGAKKQK